MQRCIGRLTPTRSILLLCDMQEKFARTIQYFNEIVDTSSRVLDTCKIAKVPYLVTEHYPKGWYLVGFVNNYKVIGLSKCQGLGRTVPKLQEKIDKSLVFEKTRFSMCTSSVLEKMEQIAPS